MTECEQFCPSYTPNTALKTEIDVKLSNYVKNNEKTIKRFIFCYTDNSYFICNPKGAGCTWAARVVEFFLGKTDY